MDVLNGLDLDVFMGVIVAQLFEAHLFTPATLVPAIKSAFQLSDEMSPRSQCATLCACVSHTFFDNVVRINIMFNTLATKPTMIIQFRYVFRIANDVVLRGTSNIFRIASIVR